MSRPFHYAIPQRPSPSGWTECEPAQAKRFAVMSVRKFRSSGRDLSVTRTHGSYRTFAEAAAVASQLNAGRNPHKADTPALGQRFPQRGREIIARGIGRDVLP